MYTPYSPNPTKKQKHQTVIAGIDTTQLETRLFINNEFVPSIKEKKFETVNPATEEVICEVWEAGVEDVDRAVSLGCHLMFTIVLNSCQYIIAVLSTTSSHCCSVVLMHNLVLVSTLAGKSRESSLRNRQPMA
jgi:hypothetical protein